MEVPDMTRQYTEHWKDGCLQCVNLDGTAMSIPGDPANMDYDYYLKWKKAGGVPTVIDDTYVQTLQDFRREEYNKAGITAEELIVALWEKVVEQRPEKAEELQARRMIIKEQYPKE